MNPCVSRHTKPPQIQTKMSQTVQQENDSVNNSPTTPQSTSTSSSSSVTIDEEVRIVFLGSAKVGKTSIIQRFLHNHFESKYTPTVEDIHLKKFIIRDHLVKLVLMDTAGSYDFPAMLRLCINKANAFVIVFAHDNLDSLMQAGHLLTQIKSQRKDYAPLASNTLNNQYDDCIFNMNVASPPIVVVCNKSDLPNSDSQVSEGAIMEWLLTNGLKPSQFVYASAKSNDSIMAIFKSLWLQNTVSKAIKLARWDGVRRTSLTNSQQITSPHSTIMSSNTNAVSSTPASTQKETDFSALSGTVTNTSSANPCSIHVYSHSSNGSPDANVNEQKSSTTKSRQAIFRNSFRLSRRSSGKTNKSKPDIVHMDCVIS